MNVNDCPVHYAGDGNIRCGDAMKSMFAGARAAGREPSGMALWWWGCALKYVWRWPVKGKDAKEAMRDIDKAMDCLARLRREAESGGLQRRCRPMGSEARGELEDDLRRLASGGACAYFGESQSCRNCDATPDGCVDDVVVDVLSRLGQGAMRQ